VRSGPHGVVTTTAPRPPRTGGSGRRSGAEADAAGLPAGRRRRLSSLLPAGSVALVVGYLVRRRGRRPDLPSAAMGVKVVAPRRPRGGARGAVWTGARARAAIGARTLRTDRYWVQPLITVVVLVLFIAYSTVRAFQSAHYFSEPYISPFYSPCLTTGCEGNTFPKLFTGPSWISPAIYILIFPLGFRLTCYYYRKAYYRSFWLSPPACAVAEPHKRYTGETRLPLLGQNAHRYFFYFGLILNGILTYDAVLAFRDQHGAWGHMGLGTLVLVANAVLLWLYSLSCHSCRHIVGGRLNSFSRHPVRYRFWTVVSKLNARHMQLAWVSLFGVALTDAYVYLLAGGVFSDPRFF
jgi:hypothetical protein